MTEDMALRTAICKALRAMCDMAYDIDNEWGPFAEVMYRYEILGLHDAYTAEYGDGDLDDALKADIAELRNRSDTWFSYRWRMRRTTKETENAS